MCDVTTSITVAVAMCDKDASRAFRFSMTATF